MIALIDCDIVNYSCSVGLDDMPVGAAYERADGLIATILQETKSDQCILFQSGPRDQNFRHIMWPLYKANRKDVARPVHLKAVEEYMYQVNGAEISDCCEADDRLGINQTEKTILCTIDKDLDMVPGLHYNWRRKEIYEINNYAGQFNFWKQMLVGDSTDNVKGVTGIGEKKATQRLQQLEPHEWPEYVKDLYDDNLRFDLNYNLLRIWQKPYQLYYNNKDNVMLNKEDFLAKLEELRDQFKALIPQEDTPNTPEDTCEKTEG